MNADVGSTTEAHFVFTPANEVYVRKGWLIIKIFSNYVSAGENICDD